MTEEILEGIAAVLHEVFGEEYPIYPDEAPQELTPPCFLLSEVGVAQTLFLGERKKKDRVYLVQYFPVSETEALKECREVAERLMDGLEVIYAGEMPLRCRDVQYSIDREQRVLSVTVNCNTIAWKAKEREAMETLDMEMEVGHG